MRFRIFVLGMVMAAVCMPGVAQQKSLPVTQTDSEERKLLGRIVLYDWIWHETTSKEDFIVKIQDGKDATPQYVRVLYARYWGFDAPPTEAMDLLTRWAFVGRGSKWEFIVHTPQTVEEKGACTATNHNPRYEDESGSGELPRYVPTPGAEGMNIPTIGSLPCFILKHGGLAQEKSDNNVPR